MLLKAYSSLSLSHLQLNDTRSVISQLGLIGLTQSLTRIHRRGLEVLIIFLFPTITPLIFRHSCHRLFCLSFPHRHYHLVVSHYVLASWKYHLLKVSIKHCRKMNTSKHGDWRVLNRPGYTIILHGIKLRDKLPKCHAIVRLYCICLSRRHSPDDSAHGELSR